MSIVNVPGVGPVNFPEGMSQRDIIRAIEFDILPSVRPPAPAVVAERPRGGSSLLRGFNEYQGTLYSAGEGVGSLTGIRALERFGREGRLRNEQEAQQSLPDSERMTFERAEGVGQNVRAAGQALGMSLPSMVPGLAGTLAGAAIGSAVPVVGTIAGGVIGGTLASLPQFYGANRQRQIQESGSVQSEGAALGTAIPQALSEGVVDRITLGLGRVLGIGGEAVARNVIPRIVRGVGVGAATEVPAEVFQQALERAQAGLDVLSNEAMAEYREAATAAAVVGGTVGGTFAGALGGRPSQSGLNPDNLPPELRQAIGEYVGNREPLSEGQLRLPRETPDIETPVGNLSRSQLLRFMERRLPGMVAEDPEIASRMSYARNENERLDAFREILQQQQDGSVTARQGSEEGNIRREVAFSPETQDAFRRAAIQRETGVDVSKVGSRVPLERDTPYAGARLSEAERAFEQVDLQQRTGRKPFSEQDLRRDLATAEQQIEQLIDARLGAERRLAAIEQQPVTDLAAREATQAEIAQLNQLIAGREQIRREIANSIPVTERQNTARENMRASAGPAFDIAQAREERRAEIAAAPGIEVPTGTVITQPIGPNRVSVPELETKTVDQPGDDARAGRPKLTEMRYVLNPQYSGGRLVGGEAVVEILPTDNAGGVLAYVRRQNGQITETVPVETTMDQLAQLPVRETARMTQEAAGAAVGPDQIAGSRGRGIDAEGQTLQPRRMVDRQGPEASARDTQGEQAQQQAEPTETDARASRRISAQNRINTLYLNKLKDRGRQGRLLRNALVDALKDRTLTTDQVYAAFVSADVIAPILPAGADHQVQFVRELLAPTDAAERSGGVAGQQAQGIRFRPNQPGMLGLIQLSLAPNQMPFLRETAAHEAFHVLQDYYGKFDPQFAKLISRGFRDGMMIADVDPTIRRKLEQARFPNSDKSYWQILTSSLPNAMNAREAQAYAFGALMDASRRGTPMAGLKPAFARFVNAMRQFFDRMGSKLRGDGFQTAEDLMGRVAQGDARRFDDRATPTGQDFPNTGVQASARATINDQSDQQPASRSTRDQIATGDRAAVGRRGERRTGETSDVEILPEEQAILDGIKDVNVRRVAAQRLRETKAFYPIEDGWAPLELRDVTLINVDPKNPRIRLLVDDLPDELAAIGRGIIANSDDTEADSVTIGELRKAGVQESALSKLPRVMPQISFKPHAYDFPSPMERGFGASKDDPATFRGTVTIPASRLPATVAEAMNALPQSRQKTNYTYSDLLAAGVEPSLIYAIMAQVPLITTGGEVTRVGRDVGSLMAKRIEREMRVLFWYVDRTRKQIQRSSDDALRDAGLSPADFNDKDPDAFEQSVRRLLVRQGKLTAKQEGALNTAAQRSWYTGMRTELRKMFGGIGDLATDLLGATSARTPVATNWRQTIDALRAFKSGSSSNSPNAEALAQYKEFRERGGKTNAWEKEGNALVLREGVTPNFESLPSETQTAFRNALGKKPTSEQFFTYNDLRTLGLTDAQSQEILVNGTPTGKKFNANTMSVMDALIDRFVNKTSPKTPTYAGNLIGRTDEGTIDVWAARTLQRVRDLLFGDAPRIPPRAEIAVGGERLMRKDAAGRDVINGQFGFGQYVLRQAAEGLDMRPDELQALLWFYEKDLWTERNWTSAVGEGGSIEDSLGAMRSQQGVARFTGGLAPMDQEGTSAVSDMFKPVADMLRDESGVIAFSGNSQRGLYGSYVETSADFEVIATKDFDQKKLAREVFKAAAKNDQWDAFVARRLGDDETSPNARPGFELYFREPQTFDQIQPILDSLRGQGVDGFTTVGDPRSPNDRERIVGIRMIWTPEFQMTYDDDLREQLEADPAAADEMATEWRGKILDTINGLENNPLVGSVIAGDYDVLVAGATEYGTAAQDAARAEERDASASGGPGAWGRTLGEAVSRRAGVLREARERGVVWGNGRPSEAYGPLDGGELSARRSEEGGLTDRQAEASARSTTRTFQQGETRRPEFSARSPLARDPAFQATLEKITGKDLDKPNVFSDGLRRFAGALPGEKVSSALIRTTVNRVAPLWMMDRLAKEKGLTLRSAGLAMEVALNNSGRVQMYLEHGPLAYDPKTGNVSIREDAPGLIDAIKGRLNVQDKREAQSYLVSLRERDLRSNGKKGFFNLTDAEVDQIISKSEAAHPEWKGMASDIQRINKALLDFAVSTGTLDRSKADQLASMFYTPFYRQAEDDAKDRADAAIGPRLSDSMTNVKTAFDVKLKGGVNPLGDLFENMIRNADVIMKAGMKNVAMRQAAETMDAAGLGREVKAREAGKTITYRVDGQDKHFEVDDAVLYATLAGAPREFANGIYKTMATMAGFFRDMITAAPSFMLANLWRGKTMAYVQEGLPFYTNTFDGLRQALKASTSYKAIATQTGFGGYTYGMGERDAAKAFEREIKGLGYGPGGMMRRAFDALQKASEATEMAERIKLYERMKVQGMTDKEAAYQAYLLAPFSRRGMGGGWVGSTVNWLVPLVPFLNAKIQGMYRLIENEKGDTQKLWTLGIPKQMFLRGLVVMGASLALAAKNMGDEPERWDNETPDLKMRYDILYLPGGNRILFPRAFEVGNVFGALPVFILDAIRRDDGRDIRKMLTDIGTSTFFFNPIPQALVPALSAATNYDFFRGRALENAGDLSKLPEERVNRNTSTVARLAGEAAGVSPIRIQSVIEGYSGTIGTSVLAGFDSILAGMGLIPNKPAGAFGDPLSMPAVIAGLTGASRFYRSDDQVASRFVGDFYRIKEQVEQLNRSLTGARERGDAARITELQGQEGIPLRLRPMVNNANRQLSTVNEQMRRLEQQRLSSEDLADRLKPLRERRDMITRRVVERARELGM